MERDTLIRTEVIQRRARRDGARPLFHQPVLLSLGVALALVLPVIALALLALTHYRLAEPVRGLLEASGFSYRVVAPTAAVVSEILVREGQAVAAGQVLALLDKSGFNVEGLNTAQGELAQLDKQAALLREEVALLSAQTGDQQRHSARVIEDMRASLQLGNEEARLVASQLARSETNLMALRRLRSQGAITSSQLDHAWVEHVNLKLRLQDVRQRQQALKTQLDLQRTRQSEIATASAHNALKLKQEQERLAQARAQLLNDAHLGVVAAVAGVVKPLAIEANQFVITGQPLFQIEDPRMPLRATLYVPSRLHGKLRRGQELWLSYDAFLYQHYGRYRAIITDVASASLDPREHRLPLLGLDEPVFEVHASLDKFVVTGPDSFSLRPGMLFYAEIVFEELSLLEYLFKPLLELRERVS